MKHVAACLMVCALIGACVLMPQVPSALRHPPPKKDDSGQPQPLSQEEAPQVTPITAGPGPTEVDKGSESDMGSPMIATPLEITILYDNYAYDASLKTAWGFSALIRYGETTILFDTGGDAPTLMGNLSALGFDPGAVDIVVLSHAHHDHVGGLDGFLDQNTRPPVYLLPSFPSSFKRGASRRTEVIEVAAGQTLVDGVLTTGEMGSDIREQALAIQTESGLVVITGCAHPGIVEIIERARQIGGHDVHLVIGGFHLRNATASEIDSIVADFRRLGVEKVAPTHCTGDLAIARFEEAFGEDFIRAGVGRQICVDCQP
jgi:7,8-dihydropterin-6-yl-methyl-4-(beta-D-ribofuranosyl)aminobenzene 5'-phosphate synthase